MYCLESDMEAVREIRRCRLMGATFKLLRAAVSSYHMHMTHSAAMLLLQDHRESLAKELMVSCLCFARLCKPVEKTSVCTVSAVPKPDTDVCCVLHSQQQQQVICRQCAAEEQETNATPW